MCLCSLIEKKFLNHPQFFVYSKPKYFSFHYINILIYKYTVRSENILGVWMHSTQLAKCFMHMLAQFKTIVAIAAT